VGRGVTVGAILGDFSQGSMESTNESTDVAIAGNGFFQVSPPAEEINYYTRAGNFRFNDEGYLVDPHGYRVQGWGMEDGAIEGVPVDIQLENFQSPPAETENVSIVANLDSESDIFENAEAGNIWEDWDGQANPPIDANNYSYQSTLKIYDENGGGHDLSVYFRQSDNAADPNKSWEFIVTVPPGDDTRGVGAGEEGLLFRGEMIFNAAGEIVDMQNMENILNQAGDANEAPAWPDDFRNGYPLVYTDFFDAGPGEMQEIELNFGALFGEDPANAGDPIFDQREANATTSYASPSTTLSQNQDGYTAGFLQNVSFDREGVMTGRYSNGQVQDLYTLTLGDFNNVWGLRREGGNLFAETRDSGQAFTGTAGSGRFGTVSGNSLELSNVDLATEFVKMISSQKGFQANSKTITTTDTMLDEVIRMKR